MNIHDLSAIENDTIVAFLEQASADGHLTGDVLDYGCGKAPYRALVERTGRWQGYDRAQFGGNVSGRNIGPTLERDGGWDAVLSTQVVQYSYDPRAWLIDIAAMLKPDGHLVMTYPGAWPVLRDHLWSFTQAGMECLLDEAGLTVVRHEQRAALPFEGFEIPTGFGVVARS